VTRELFEREIKEVVPKNICFEKPSLAETIYGARKEGDSKVIVQRAEVVSLAQKPISHGKTKFDLEYARKQIRSVRDEHIKQRLAEFLTTDPAEEAWQQFCQTLCLKRKDESAGSPVKLVCVNVGGPGEYKDLSKDGTGAYRKALKGHKGQIVYIETTAKKGVEKKVVQVRPVYAFESVDRVRAELKQEFGDKIEFRGFFQSGCLISFDRQLPVESFKLVVWNEAKQKRRIAATSPLMPSKFLLNTIITDSRVVEMTTANGNLIVSKLDPLIKAGLQRMD